MPTDLCLRQKFNARTLPLEGWHQPFILDLLSHFSSDLRGSSHLRSFIDLSPLFAPPRRSHPAQLGASLSFRRSSSVRTASGSSHKVQLGFLPLSFSSFGLALTQTSIDTMSSQLPTYGRLKFTFEALPAIPRGTHQRLLLQTSSTCKAQQVVIHPWHTCHAICACVGQHAWYRIRDRYGTRSCA